MSTTGAWWETLFDDKYLSTYVDLVTEERTEAQLEFLQRVLEPRPGMSILDLACGYGRLSVPLARLGYRVTGLDFSRHFLDIARRKAIEEDLEIGFLQADMRRFEFDEAFDATISIFTSFGYFDDARQDLRVLRCVKRGLRSGGRFVLDFVNVPKAIGFIYERGEVDPKSGELVTEKMETLSNGLEVRQTDRLDVETLRWRMRRSWLEAGRERSYESDVRMYVLPELRSLIEEAGLEVREVYGDFDGSSYRPDSRRMIILSVKRGSPGG